MRYLLQCIFHGTLYSLIFLSFTIASLGRKEEAHIWTVLHGIENPIFWHLKLFVPGSEGGGWSSPLQNPCFQRFEPTYDGKIKLSRVLCACYISICFISADPNWIKSSKCSKLIAHVHLGQPTCTSSPSWSTTYLYLWLLVNLLVLLSQAGHLSNPGVDHRLDLVLAHQRQRHVRLRAEAHHPAGSSSGCRSKTILKIC